jgi:uncharacterized protein (DUF2237 family)
VIVGAVRAALEVLEAAHPQRVVLRATHEETLNHCALADLKRHAIDLA